MHTRSTSGRVLVVGGGIVGLSVARALAGRGVSCTLLERDAVAAGATHAAGGMLSPLGEASGPGPFLRLARDSLARYPAFVAGLDPSAGGTGFRICGKLLVAFDDEDAQRLTERAAWQREAGLQVRLLDGAGARSLEPALSGTVRCGLHLATDGVVDNRRLGPALARAAVAAGAEVREGAGVRAIEELAGAVAGVVLLDGTRVAGDRVVVAAGAWSGGIQGLPRKIPVRPVRGQMLSLAPGGTPLGGVVGAPGAYLIPRATEAGPRVVVGATEEDAGFRQGNDPAAVAALRRAAVRAAPVLSGAPVEERWWGFRPGTPDGLPILGEDPDMPGLVWATGHHRNGILLAPATAHHLERLVVDGDGSGLEAFSPARFGD